MQLTRRLAPAVAGLVLSLLTSVCAGSTLSAEDSAMLADTARFQMLPATATIPAEVLDCCGDGERRLARPGERWVTTDALSAGSNMARRRLVWMAQSPDLTVVHFEQGGIAHSFHIVVLGRKAWPKAGAIIWRASGPQVADYAQFASALAGGSFSAEP